MCIGLVHYMTRHHEIGTEMAKRAAINVLLWFYWTLLLVGMIAIAPVVIVYALLFDPD
jgi:hypothetical protein